jgi:dienelactone hydrolase
MRWLALLLLGFLLAALLPAQPVLTFPPPEVVAPDKDTLQTIQARTEKLAAALDRLGRLKVQDPTLADVEIYLKAAQWVAHHNEYYGKNAAKQVLAVLDRGLLRASQAGRGESPWMYIPGQPVVRAYRSKIDGSVQPYAVTYPHDYAANNRKSYRIDVVLHGRNSGLTEVKFLHDHSGDKPAPKDLSYVQLDIYGRGNNAYRWAGEIDVWEAIENFLTVEGMLGRRGFIDTSKSVLRGFSMGGAGTWHIGLHRPDQWAVLGPGAGFTTTIGYVPKKVSDSLTDYQKKTLHIYDAVDYAENAFNVPVVAYSGAEDPQKQAALNIEAKLKPLGVSMTHLIAPKLKHEFPAEWRKKAEAEYARLADRERFDYPPKVRFVTWTLKYPKCHWVDLLALDRHYERSSVEAEKTDKGFSVKTSNVRALQLSLWAGAIHDAIDVTIDGQKMEGVMPNLSRTAKLAVYLEKAKGKWRSVLPERLVVDQLRIPQKMAGLQGPIDDAFMNPFLCVRGTGTPWNQKVEAHAAASLARFKSEWSKYLRGELPIKDDNQVTADDIATKHLILFGDPGSNSLIQQVAPRLPFAWSKKIIDWNGKEYAADKHVPVLVTLSPLATNHYVVLNSGHTFHADDFEKTNAMLYPRLGDFALLELTGAKEEPLANEVRSAGLFDDFWHFPERK